MGKRVKEYRIPIVMDHRGRWYAVAGSNWTYEENEALALGCFDAYFEDDEVEYADNKMANRAVNGKPQRLKIYVAKGRVEVPTKKEIDAWYRKNADS